MKPSQRKITVALLAIPEVGAATLYGIHDVLAGVHRDWQMVHRGPAMTSPFRPLVVSRDGVPLRVGNGVLVTPDAGLADHPVPDVICVTDVMLPPEFDVRARYASEIAWLRQAWQRGATLASACSGALLLAATDLLDGFDATSHWAYCDHLARLYPRTRWNADRGLVVTGPQGRILMAGSGSSWHMLALALVARHVSAEDAMRVARINLFNLDETSPLAYASLLRSATSDPLIERCQAWAAHHYRSAAPVAKMSSLSGLSQRTFQRRFYAATGMSPLDYVHMLRLEEAKQMLESTTLSVEAIAREVGYQDVGFFSRLFKRKVSLSAVQYRNRFFALGSRLRALSA